MTAGHMKISDDVENGNRSKKWGPRKRIAALVAFLVAVACIICAAYFIGSKPKKPFTDGGVFSPPDPEEEQPPSFSELHVFKRGAVCTDGAPCSTIGRNILDKNGSAVDATIAAMICNGIVNQQSMGIGGGFLMTIYSRETKSAVTLIAREKAPIKATTNMFKGDPKLSLKGPLSIGVPGELRGYWEAHKRFGKLPWRELFEPSLELCRTGYNITKHQHDSVTMHPEVLVNDNLKEVFIDKNTNEVKPKGSNTKPSKAFCKSLARIAEKGGDELYNGTLAEEFLQDLKDAGTIFTKEDLINYRPKWADPISVPLFGENRLFSIPPPGSGALLGFIINILAGYNFTKDSISDLNSTVLTYHRILEAFKYAYARRTLLGDADYVDVSELVKNLTSTSYANDIRLLINDSATSNNASHYGAQFVNQPDHGTAHISVLAPNGDAVSVTSTVNWYFGSGIVTKNTGIIMNNNMDDFASPGIMSGFGLPPSPANFIEPGKRPMSSMSPSIIIDKNGDVKIVIGASGGTKITTAVAQVVARSLWFGQTIKQAVDAPRLHHQVFPMEINYEYGNLKQVMQGLQSLGHKINRYTDRGSVVCAMFRNATGIYANADYRKGGDVYGID